MKNWIFLFVFICLFISCKTQHLNQYTYCTLTGYVLKKNHYNESEIFPIWEYEVNGIKYAKQWGVYHEEMIIEQDTVIGSKYKFAYDSLHPRKSGIPEYNHPLFLPSEKTAVIGGTITVAWPTGCEYEFSNPLNGEKKTYLRIQYYDKSIAEKYPDLKTGDQFEVEYLVSNPIRSIMHFDRPIH